MTEGTLTVDGSSGTAAGAFDDMRTETEIEAIDGALDAICD
ncbi:hypothetical protein BH23ACT5_BH23ACT5_24040 [soil metagenome]